MRKNRTPTPVYLDPGMHPGLEVKGLTIRTVFQVLKCLYNYYNVTFDSTRLIFIVYFEMFCKNL